MTDKKPPGVTEKRRLDQKTRIQESIQRAEAEKRRELFRKRLEIVTSGIDFYKKGKVREATVNFHTYIKILEQWKDVPEGGLTPAKFDADKDSHEILLLSGVYWDLAKLYDRTKSAESAKEFRHYIGKYVLFSKGFPHQHLSAESMRKYIRSNRSVHKKDFMDAYRALGGSNCFIATSLIDVIDEQTLPDLRLYRDQVLKNSVCGRVIVSTYELTTPALARQIPAWPEPVRKSIAKLLDRIALCVRANSVTKHD